MTRLQGRILFAAALACAAALAGRPVLAQVAPGAPAGAAVPAAKLSSADLETLVGPIALYPDDLVAIVLPAATNPVQLVQAERYLDKRKANPKLPVDAKWDDAVKALLNYPDIVKKMSADLDWTTALGEAVVADQGAVLAAVQSFRRKTQSAGNLKTDGKQVIVVEKEVIKIVPADPQVIYVPQYNPTTVVVPSPVPVYAYYPTPYPAYYYPYPPGAALATGVIWGAALGAAWNGNQYATHYGSGGGNSVTINNPTTINTGGTVSRSGSATTLPASTSAWKPSTQPGQVGSVSTRPATTAGYAPRSASTPSNLARGGAQQGQAPSSAQRAQGGAFGGMDSGGGAHQASARGQESRGSFGGGGRQSATAGATASRGSAGGARTGGRGGQAGGARGGGGRR